MEEHELQRDDSRVYFSHLYRMGDNLSYNLAHAGHKVAKYVPYGPIKSVLPYLFRKAEENTAVVDQSSQEFLLIKAETKRSKELSHPKKKIENEKWSKEK